MSRDTRADITGALDPDDEEPRMVGARLCGLLQGLVEIIPVAGTPRPMRPTSSSNEKNFFPQFAIEAKGLSRSLPRVRAIACEVEPWKAGEIGVAEALMVPVHGPAFRFFRRPRMLLSHGDRMVLHAFGLQDGEGTIWLRPEAALGIINALFRQEVEYYWACELSSIRSAAWDRGIIGPFLGPRRYVSGSRRCGVLP